MADYTKLQRLHDVVADHLARMEDLFAAPEDYRLTFIARHVGNPRAHVIVSSEEPGERGDKVRETLSALEVDGEEFRTGSECNTEDSAK